MEIAIIIVICIAAYLYFNKKPNEEELSYKLASYSKGLGDLMSNSDFLNLTRDEKELVENVGIDFYYACLLRCCENRLLSKETVNLIMLSHLHAHNVQYYGHLGKEKLIDHMDTLQKNLNFTKKILSNSDDLHSALTNMVSHMLKISPKEMMLTFKGTEINLKCQQFIATNVKKGIDFILKMNNLK